MSNRGKTRQMARRSHALSAAERAFVKAFARWKARADYESWCSRQPKDRSASGVGGRVRTCDLSRGDYHEYGRSPLDEHIDEQPRSSHDDSESQQE